MKNRADMYTTQGAKRYLMIAGITFFGFVAGFSNGLLGAGGGIIIIFIFRYLLKEKFEDSRDIYANSLAVILPISIFSAFIYLLKGHLADISMGKYVIPAIVGGFVGGILLERMKKKFLNIVFALIVIYSGISMAIR